MYVKLFSSILTSSVWAEDVPTRIVWITLLALADKEGDVRSSPSGLARVANVTPEDCQRALAKFLAPDPESGTKTDDGRRIEERDGGWFIINYAKYRAIQDAEARKASWRESSRKHRERQRTSAPSAPRHRKSTEADTEAESKAEATTTASTLADEFADPDHRAAYLAVREQAPVPAAFDAAVRAVVKPVGGGAAYPWVIVGGALLELRSSNGDRRVSASSLRAFCKRLTEDKARGSGASLNRTEQGYAHLVAYLEKSQNG